MWNQFQRVRALALIAGLLTVAAGCGRDDHGRQAAPGGVTAVTHRETSRGAGPQVIIDNFTFTPSTLTVAVGTTVTWINRDDVPHTATSTAKPKSFQSGTLDTDDTFAHTFTAPGTYPYFCAVHPKMTGQIIVK